MEKNESLHIYTRCINMLLHLQLQFCTVQYIQYVQESALHTSINIPSRTADIAGLYEGRYTTTSPPPRTTSSGTVPPPSASSLAGLGPCQILLAPSAGPSTSAPIDGGTAGHCPLRLI